MVAASSVGNGVFSEINGELGPGPGFYFPVTTTVVDFDLTRFQNSPFRITWQSGDDVFFCFVDDPTKVPTGLPGDYSFTEVENMYEKLPAGGNARLIVPNGRPFLLIVSAGASEIRMRRS